jgi:ribosome-binding factor A
MSKNSYNIIYPIPLFCQVALSRGENQPFLGFLRPPGGDAAQRQRGFQPLRRYAVMPLCLFLLPLPHNTKQAMESTRQKKVSRLVQKELADIFLKKGNEFAHGKLVSITRVRLSPDLSFAKIYISIFPATNQDEVLNSIQEHSSRIRFELGQKVRTQLRIVPDIAFHIDDSLDYIDKIDKLLKS